MAIQVLVTYATKYGATAEIAEKIGAVLHQSDFNTDVLPVDQVKNLQPYQAIIMGSAVYIGLWRKKAKNFLKIHEKSLAERMVWLFSSGPTGEGNPTELTKGWTLPKALQPIADRIQPRDIAVFHGKIDLEKLSAIEKWMIKKVEAATGDFRHWETITSWAMTIADELKKKVAAK